MTNKQKIKATTEPGMNYTKCYAPLSHGSLFSGIGGFELAAEWAGWENAFHCEWNEFGKKILKHYWPNAISYGDITKTDFTIHRGTIDVLTGGFPCQPYSVAGKRKGKEDERHLWPEMLRAIREIAPSYIVGENVAGLLSWNDGLVFHEVQADLEAEGYEVQPIILPACAVNAPHRRDRIWFVAYNSDARAKGLQFRRENGVHEFGTFANTSKNGWRTRRTDCNRQEQNEAIWSNIQLQSERFCKVSTATYTSSARQQEQYATTKSNRTGYNTRLLIENWSNWPTEPGICTGNDGISETLDSITFSKWRNESIKAYGNAIVPQVAYQIFKAINMHEAFLSGA